MKMMARGGGDRTKNGVETPQVVDSSPGQNYINLQIRPSGVHVGHTDAWPLCYKISVERFPRTAFVASDRELSCYQANWEFADNISVNSRLQNMKSWFFPPLRGTRWGFPCPF